MRQLLHPVLLTALIPLIGACVEIPAAHLVSHDTQLAFEDIRNLDLDTANGRVEVEAVEGDTVQVYVRFRMPESYDFSKILKIENAAGELRIREDWPRKKFFMSDRTEATYLIKVPSEISLEIESVNGRLISTGVAGPQRIESINGRIEVTTPSSEIIAGTVNGGIRATFTNEFNGARLETVNGSVKVQVPEGTEMVADVSQVNGSFNSEIPLQMKTSGVRIPVLDVSTVNGSIKVSRFE